MDVLLHSYFLGKYTIDPSLKQEKHHKIVWEFGVDK
jgi:hypothetical protein